MDTQVLPRHERRHHERRSQQASHAHEHGAGHPVKMASTYGHFAAMVATSTAIGFGGMYLNVFDIDHAYFSWTRLFMALIMGGIMTAVMMIFMWKMYPNRKINAAILGVAAALFASGVGLVRSQATVDDVGYMKAMIPHHSIAILTSTRARIDDPRVRKLADGIVETQKREIAEMKQLISDLEKR